MCVRAYVRVKSGPSNICRAETIDEIKLHSLRHLFRMTTITYKKFSSIRSKALFNMMIYVRSFQMHWIQFVKSYAVSRGKRSSLTCRASAPPILTLKNK